MAVQCRPPSALTPCPVFIRVDEGGPECVLDRDESVVRGKCVCVCVCVCVRTGDQDDCHLFMCFSVNRGFMNIKGFCGESNRRNLLC